MSKDQLSWELQWNKYLTSLVPKYFVHFTDVWFLYCVMVTLANNSPGEEIKIRRFNDICTSDYMLQIIQLYGMSTYGKFNHETCNVCNSLRVGLAITSR